MWKSRSDIYVETIRAMKCTRIDAFCRMMVGIFGKIGQQALLKQLFQLKNKPVCLDGLCSNCMICVLQ